MRILLLGASGFLGANIYEEIKSKNGLEVLGTCYSEIRDSELMKLDVTKKEQVKAVMESYNPDVVIWSLISRKSEKYMIEHGLNNLLNNMSKYQKLIFISSNAVFNGTGEFKEEDEPQYRNSNDNIALYANAKIDGENIVKRHKNYIIVRPGAIYGKNVKGIWDKRICQLVEKLQDGEEVVRTENLYNTFVKVEELSKAIVKLIEIDYSGIIHLGPAKKESHYEYNVRMAKELGLYYTLIKGNLLSEEEVFQNDEALDLSLDTSKVIKVLGEVFS